MKTTRERGVFLEKWKNVPVLSGFAGFNGPFVARFRSTGTLRRLSPEQAVANHVQIGQGAGDEQAMRVLF